MPWTSGEVVEYFVYVFALASSDAALTIRSLCLVLPCYEHLLLIRGG